MPPWLAQEISRRLAEKLEFIKLAPHQILVNPDLDLKKIKPYYPKSIFSSLGSCHANDYLTRMKRRLMGLPLVHSLDSKSRSCDLVLSNLELQHASSPTELIQAWHAVLKPEALLMFTYLGPDTAHELKKGGLALHPKFQTTDMHNVGDELLQAGFAEPVMDMEYLYLEYESSDRLMKDLLSMSLIEAHAAHLDFWAELRFPLKVTLEVVYGHAWMPKQLLSKAKDGVASIRPEQIIKKIN